MTHPWTRKSLIAAAIAASLSLAACGDNRNEPAASRSTDTTTSSTAKTTDKMTANAGATAERAGDKAAATANNVAANASDAATTAKVKTRLMAEPGIDSLQIDVDTSNGRVTLSGEVDTPQNRARAKELASSVEGVTSVVDRLTVKS
jgi:osmotically-inducible protein OsmY